MTHGHLICIDSSMVHTADVASVSYVSGHLNTHSEKQALVMGTKQTKQANKADGLAGQADLQGSQGCLICFRHRYRKAKNRLLKFCYVPAASTAQNRLLFFFFCCGCLQY